MSQAQQPAATQPATQGGHQETVLILPLESLSGDPETGDDALAQAIGRSLFVDLSRARSFHAVTGEKVAADQAAALEEGKVAGASHVVWGTVQRVEGRIRITGHVLDVERDDSAGQFKLTGSFSELFELQDQLAEQVRRRLETGDRAADLNEAIEERRSRPSSAPATAEDEPPAQVPPGQSVRIRPHPLDPDWLAAPDPYRGGNDLRYRYEYGHEPYWSVPYTYGYNYGFGGYHHSFYRPYRPLYQHRAYDYTYRGLPDRHPYRGFGPRHLRSFTGPVPLRWYDDH